MGFLSALFTIVLVVYLLGYVLRWLFPRLIVWLARRQMRKQMGDAFGSQQAYEQRRQQQQRQQQRRGPRWWPFGSQQGPEKPRRGKIISEDVGEYVEFEEIRTYQSSEYEAPRPVVKPEQQVDDAEWEEV